MRLSASLRLSAFVLLPLVWYAHVGLTEFGDPFGIVLDGLLWAGACALKILVLASLWGLFERVHQAVFAAPRRALTAFALWAAAGLVTLGALAWSRQWWAPLLKTDAVKFYYLGDGLRLGSGLLGASRERWLLAWANGSVVGSECALLLLLAGIHAAVAYRIGKLGWRSVLIASAACASALLAYAWWCPWCRVDYDLFHGDVLALALLVDPLLVLMANDPYSSLALPLYLALGVANLAILKWSGPPGGEPLQA